jgi:glycerate dehydrogenase
MAREVINLLPELMYIGVLATGYDVVDTVAAAERGIVVTNVPAYSTDSVIQMVFALLFELCTNVKAHSDAVHEKEWSRNADFCFWKYSLVEIAGKTMGIIGFGKTGQKVAHVAKAFGMKVIVYSRMKIEGAGIPHVEWVSLDEVFKQSDVLTIHCPLNDSTKGIVNKDTLRLMKSSAFLINTARGGVIVEQDVADALNEGVIAGAGVDVLSTEPPRDDNPMLTAKNCLITPHIAWATNEARQRLMDIAVRNVKAFIDGNPVNKVN